MKKPLAERIDQLRQKTQRDAARLATLQAKAKQADRKLDTRRKIVVGAAVMTEMARNPRFAEHVRTMLRQDITRPQDRDAIAFLLEPTPPLPPKPVIRVQASHTPAEPPAAPQPPSGSSSPEAGPASDWRPRSNTLSKHADSMLRR